MAADFFQKRKMIPGLSFMKTGAQVFLIPADMPIE